jgi:2-polyprenyl-6-methoxyphenol hydroxylase-like FAD-dependent oxidoreductase
MHQDETEVLVVGAGPVGLITALLLARSGIQVEIIDREERTAARSYACALHPQTLGLLHRLGLAEGMLERGRQLRTLAFYDGKDRQAQIDLSAAGGEFPFLLVLPQNVLEEALEQKLSEAGVSVQWNFRFDALQQEEEKAVIASVEELGGTSTGYIVPHWEMVVTKRRLIRARFLVGADGVNSLVRQRRGIGCETAAPKQFFAAVEFESDDSGTEEVRVVLDEATTNVLWPLPGNKFRWTFQNVKSEPAGEFPDKERRAARYAPRAVDEAIRHYLQRAVEHRAPWFEANVKSILWCTEVGFEPHVAREFGSNRCWLAGDAAHQTGPVGAQSMNAGLVEAETLAGCLTRILREKAGLNLLETYGRDQHRAWRLMLGLGGDLKPGAQSSAWVRQRCRRILPCLPGSGSALTGLARQLQLDFAPTGLI